MKLNSRRYQIWHGTNIDPAKAAKYRTRWVRRHAQERGILFPDALAELIAEYGEPGEPVENVLEMSQTQAEKYLARTQEVAKSNRAFARLPGKTKTVKERIHIRKSEYPDGPGTKFEELSQSFGIEKTATCSCEKLKTQMNKLGAEGCRENRAELIDEISKNFNTLGVLDKAKAILRGGFPSWLNPLDPVGSMFDEAVRLAEEDEQSRSVPAAPSES